MQKCSTSLRQKLQNSINESTYLVLRLQNVSWYTVYLLHFARQFLASGWYPGSCNWRPSRSQALSWSRMPPEIYMYLLSLSNFNEWPKYWCSSDLQPFRLHFWAGKTFCLFYGYLFDFVWGNRIQLIKWLIIQSLIWLSLLVTLYVRMLCTFDP